MIREIQDRILQLKKEKDVLIAAHSYQAKEILEIADIQGDSFQLSRLAGKAPQSTVLLCGVHFMAQTVKLLCPQKRVLIANPDAGCAMADCITPEDVRALRAKYPGYTAVCYINTTAEVKALCDVCVTSSSAEKIVAGIENDKILFIPDRNLGRHVAKACPQKQFAFFDGCCPVHDAVTPAQVAAARAAHPNALLLVHPECAPEVCDGADYIGSTAGIMDYAKGSDATEFIIGTELSIAEHLSYAMPHKRFYPLAKCLLCPDMKLTTLPDVLDALQGGGTEITIPTKLQSAAVGCIEEMLRLG